MKNLLRSAAALALALAPTVSFAQETPKPVLTYNQAVEAAAYLARQKTFAAECPFSDPAKAALGRLDTTITPMLGLAAPELTVIDTDTRKEAIKLINDPQVKRMACPLLEAALRKHTGLPQATKAQAK